MASRSRHPIRKLLLACAALLLGLVLASAGYLLYLNAHCARIADNVDEPNAGATPALTAISTDTTYTALTYNIGFGAYTPDFSFFMETGAMKDGTPTQGKRGVAASKESVEACIEGDIATVTTAANGQAPNLVLLQEVDENATRSYHVNQSAMASSCRTTSRRWQQPSTRALPPATTTPCC